MGTTPLLEPVFFKIYDVNGKNEVDDNVPLPYEIYKAVGAIVGIGNVDIVQSVRSLYRIYVKSKEARANLLTRDKLPVCGHLIQLYDKNPFITRQGQPSDPRERVTIRDLPPSISNEEIERYLKENDINIVGDIKWGKIRNLNKELTSCRNGDRFVYAVGPITPVRKRNIKINGINCRLFHDGQFRDHCSICKTADHKTGSTDCPAGCGNLDIFPFRSHESVFSNFYKCTINIYDNTFDSTEKAYQFRQAKSAGMDDLANEIKSAKHAGAAKQLSKQIPKEFRDEWEKQNVGIMREILCEKVKQVPEFHRALVESNNQILVEATSDPFWASGLLPDQTKITHPNFWPGHNTLGKLMMEIRHDMATEVITEVKTFPISDNDSVNLTTEDTLSEVTESTEALNEDVSEATVMTPNRPILYRSTQTPRTPPTVRRAQKSAIDAWFINVRSPKRGPPTPEESTMRIAKANKIDAVS